MSDYAFYLWGAYSVTVVCLVLEIVFLLKRKREAKA
jgi:heme exporter protein CcmD